MEQNKNLTKNLEGMKQMKMLTIKKNEKIRDLNEEVKEKEKHVINTKC